MDWPHLVALLGGGAGVTVLVRQLLGFIKFVLKRRAVLALMKVPDATSGDVLAMANAMRIIDTRPSTRAHATLHSDVAPSDSSARPRLLPEPDETRTSGGPDGRTA